MFIGVYNATNDSGSDTCSEKAEAEVMRLMKQDPHRKNLHILLHKIQKVKQPEMLKFKVKSATTTLKKVQVTIIQKLATLIVQTIAQRRLT